MKIFYADDSYIKRGKDDRFPKIQALGGLLITVENEKILTEIIKKIKRNYTHENLPVKWNFKDDGVKDAFKEFGRIKDWETMKSESNKWRFDIFQESVSVEYKLMISCIEHYSDDRNVVKEKKEEISVFLFENLLMRLAREAMSDKNDYYVVLDWPSESNPKPYNRAYYNYFNNKIEKVGVSLSEVGFYQSVLYTKCTHSPMLQFSDMIVGAFKDSFERFLQNRSDCFADEIVKTALPKFRKKWDNTLLGYGIVPSTSSPDFRKKVENYINDFKT